MSGLREMSEQEIDAACRLIAEAMNIEEAKWAKKTMLFHFGCKAHGFDDGRHYFTYSVDERILGLVGLHHYEWGPEENVWLAWFAVHPEHQRKGIGRSLLDSIEKRAVTEGYTKLFVETYDHPDFAKAQQFYQSCGFGKVGQIDDYLPGSQSMVVYLKNLASSAPSISSGGGIG